MKLAQLQRYVSANKEENLICLAKDLQKLKENDVDFVTTGEMFLCPYETSNFPTYAEPEGGESWKKLSALAKEHRIYLQAGSVPECDEEGHIYNTAYVFDRDGRQIAKHRKMHLFDIQVSNGQHFCESDTLTAGNTYTVFDTEFGRMGICICFDFRFPELARLMVQDGAQMLIVPAAFNMTTGPAHWEALFRSRAIDNQCFVAGTSVARDMNASYHAWGHTMVVSPWGGIVGELLENEDCLIREIDFSEVERVRQELPLLTARRLDIYQLTPVEKN